MNEKILKQFQVKAKALAKAKKKDRFTHVVGKFKRAKFLDAPEIPEYNGPVQLEDALWAGTIEPRILEVLPALMATRPHYLRNYGIPADLNRVIEGIRKGKAIEEFRGIPPKNYCQWLPKQVTRSRLKTFRMQEEDLACMKRLRERFNLKSDIEVLRRALNHFEKFSTE